MVRRELIDCAFPVGWGTRGGPPPRGRRLFRSRDLCLCCVLFCCEGSVPTRTCQVGRLLISFQAAASRQDRADAAGSEHQGRRGRDPCSHPTSPGPAPAPCWQGVPAGRDGAVPMFLPAILISLHGTEPGSVARLPGPDWTDLTPGRGRGAQTAFG